MKVPGETGLHKYVQSKSNNVLVFNYNFINIIACNYRLAVTSQQVFNNFEYMIPQEAKQNRTKSTVCILEANKYFKQATFNTLKLIDLS